MLVQPSHAILFELLRSLATLARTLNLSHAVKELRSTRQTVRRHIAQLEEMRGTPLFTLIDRQYVLTEAGQRALPEAQKLLARAQAWASGHLSTQGGLFSANYVEQGVFDYAMQQHPISRVMQGHSSLMRAALLCWVRAEGMIEAPAFQPLRPYILVYRPLGDSWLCSEIGEKSSFASWYGWAKAKSSVGSILDHMPGGSPFAALLADAFQDVASTHGLRYDHVHTQITDGTHEGRIPLSYQRLMMGCQFPDRSFALVSVVERTHDIDIPGVPQEKCCAMPPDLVMNVHIDFSDTSGAALRAFP
jgi:hypothetical protein